MQFFKEIKNKVYYKLIQSTINKLIVKISKVLFFSTVLCYRKKAQDLLCLTFIKKQKLVFLYF